MTALALVIGTGIWVDLFAVPAIGTLVAQSGCCTRGGCRVAAELHGRGAGMQLAIFGGTSHQMRCSWSS
jgi:hypothetical protein